MYSTKIKTKVDNLFDDLNKKVSAIVSESSNSNEAISKVTKILSSELATRSKSIMSDMLFDLSDDLMNTDFFSDITRQNKFTEVNLRQEILSKYQFIPSTVIDYKEASAAVHALVTGGAVLVVGGTIELGVALISGLSLTSLVPIPIGLVVVAAIGASLTDFYALSPKRSRKELKSAIDTFLDQTEKQFLDWFDEVESYFNKSVEEIKQIM